MIPAVACLFPSCEYITGDLDAVIVAASTDHGSLYYTYTPGAKGPSARIEKVKRSTVCAAGSSEEWSYFLSRWSDYTSATKVTGRDKVIQLLECCDEPLRRDLTRSAGGSITDKTVVEVLVAIKRLVVREENTMVARVTLHNKRQDLHETVRKLAYANLL